MLEPINLDAKNVGVLGDAVETLWKKHSTDILDRENTARLRWKAITEGLEPDWLWNAFLESLATNGGARHWEHLKFIRREFIGCGAADPLCWHQVLEYDHGKLDNWLSVAANPHFQRWKGIKRNLLDFVEAHRGDRLRSAQEELARSDRESSISIMSALPGIKDKYARNLLMGVGHLHFMDNSLALDSRIEGFLNRVTGLGHTYRSRSAVAWTEGELVRLAHRVGITAWQMDRLLFEHGNSHPLPGRSRHPRPASNI
ncbi:hypothetical protein G6K83_07835 [Agrobacterium rhizogenes]|uniref:hypothetical protein n=1 Tax=Rhizobium rhizogenes TaxID=359 RepID=UPI0015740D1F|nr:hypothetical protein [Rhizobium rhizogenes]NTH24983.1 hypothetical protein [Rhizobium rhizogenes]